MLFKSKTKIVDEEGESLFSDNKDLEIIRKQYYNAIKALHENESALLNFINALPGPTFLIDVKCRLLLGNNALAQRLDRPIDELIGQNPFDFLPSEQFNYRREKTKVVVSSGTPTTFVDFREGRYFLNSILPINDYRGKVIKAVVFSVDITAQKKTEEQLKLSEEKYKNFLERIPEGIYRSDANGNFLEVNLAMVELLGYSSKEELMKVNIKEKIYVDAKERENIVSYFSNQINNKSARSGVIKTLRLYKKDGSIIYTEDHEHFVFDEDGKFLYREGILRDITDKFKAEKGLIDSEEKYRSLFETVPIGIGIVSPGGKIISANDQALKIYGYDRDDLENLYMADLYADIADNFRLMEEIAKHGSVKNFEVEVNRKDGTKLFVSANVTPMNCCNEESFLVAFDDITERKINEESLLKLSKAVEQSPASILITDINGKIEYVNRKFTEVTGYEANEVIGKYPRLFSSGFHSKEFYKNLWETVKSGQQWRGELLNKKKSGAFYWEAVSISPVKNNKDEIKYLLAVREDITQRKLIETELRVSKDRAEKAEKLKSEFLAQMSHEIRTPINIILNYNELLREEIENKLDEETVSYFDRIDLASKRIIMTIDAILEMSALQTGTYEVKPKFIDIAKNVLENVYLEYKSGADDKNIMLELNVNTSNTTIKGDEFSMRKIFTYLVDNAVKFTREGKVEIIVNESGNKDMQVIVKDSGIGISKEYQPKLFSLFSQEEQGYSRGYEGNGLGLALVKKYCELNNASIEVKSDKGIGSEFIVTFLR